MPLAEALIAAVLISCLSYIALFLPVTYFFCTVLITSLLAVLVRRQNVLYGIASLAASAFLLLFSFKGLPSVAFIFFYYGPLGLLLGLLFKNNVPAGKSMVLMSAITIAAAMIFSGAFSKEAAEFVEREIYRSIELMAEQYRDYGLIVNAGKDVVEETARLTALFLPGNIALGAISSSVLSYFVTRYVLIKMKFAVPEVPPFTHWQLPWFAVWGAIAGLSLMLAGDEFRLAGVSDIGKNILYVTCCIYFLFGISLAIYYLQQWRIHTSVKAVTVFVAILNWPVTAGVLLLLGVLDSLIDVRGLKKNDGDVEGG